MDRMQYELLVRKAYHCGRYGVYGANADIFSGLESKVATRNGETPEQNFEIGVAMGEVITWMKSSFQKLHDEFQNDERIREAMNECMDILGEASMENIDRAGDLACKVLDITG